MSRERRVSTQKENLAGMEGTRHGGRSEIGESEWGPSSGNQAPRSIEPGGPPKEARDPFDRRTMGPSPRQALLVEQDLIKSFESGDPQVVYQAAKAMIHAFRDSQKKLAQARFKINFGSNLCNNCDGLRAGPGVVATCFQVQSCNFTNVKDSDSDPRHLRILQEFISKEP